MSENLLKFTSSDKSVASLRGNKSYELSDHLGNVRATVGREKSGLTGQVVIESSADYYPFGMKLPGRHTASSPQYRLGYQGQELDTETGFYAFQLRHYDPRLGRWLTPDPYEQHWSPYLAMSNNPVSYVDPDGGEDEMTYYVDGMKVSYTEFMGDLRTADIDYYEYYGHGYAGDHYDPFSGEFIDVSRTWAPTGEWTEGADCAYTGGNPYTCAEQVYGWNTSFEGRGEYGWSHPDNVLVGTSDGYSSDNPGHVAVAIEQYDEDGNKNGKVIVFETSLPVRILKEVKAASKEANYLMLLAMLAEKHEAKYSIETMLRKDFEAREFDAIFEIKTTMEEDQISTKNLTRAKTNKVPYVIGGNNCARYGCSAIPKRIGDKIGIENLIPFPEVNIYTPNQTAKDLTKMALDKSGPVSTIKPHDDVSKLPTAEEIRKKESTD